ncbi:MAG: C2 family cysteine protease [Elusimicrobiota bacterium]
MRIIYLTLSFVLLAAPAQARPANQELTGAANQLRRTARLSANIVRGLDTRLQKAKEKAPDAAAQLDAIHLRLVGQGGKGGLWFTLVSADRDIETALKIIDRYPDPCRGAKLGTWEALVAAEKLLRQALDELQKVPGETDGIAAADAALARLEKDAGDDRFSWKALRARTALMSYRRRQEKGLSAIKRSLQAALRAPAFGRIGQLGSRDSCGADPARETDAAAPAADNADPPDKAAKTEIDPQFKAGVDSIVKASKKPCDAAQGEPMALRRYDSKGKAQYYSFARQCQNNAVKSVLSSLEGQLACGSMDYACKRGVRTLGLDAKESFTACLDKSGSAAACLRESVTAMQDNGVYQDAAARQCKKAEDGAQCRQQFLEDQLEAAFKDVLEREIPAADKRYTVKADDPNRPDFSGTVCHNGIFDCSPVDYKYQKVEGDLFVKGSDDATPVKLDDVAQGYLGDCYYLASLAAVAQKKPQVIQNMIKDNKDGTYTVTLYTDDDRDGKLTAEKFVIDNQFPVTGSGGAAFAQVNKEAVGPGAMSKFLLSGLTRIGVEEQKSKSLLSRLGLYRNEEEVQELWPLIAEKALAQATSNGSYNIIGNGGYPSAALSDITGQASVDLTDMSVKNMAQMDGKGYAMVASSKPDPGNGKIVGGHAYAITEVDVEKGTVTLFNPWGFGNSQQQTTPTYVTLTEQEFKNAFEVVDANPIS